ncbi:hypothetical protein D931_02481 [Enterococcus faecium 13.SD.W.09]|nr:hypothetical protein D931_02481 [Enterococcus faecium 13.SD.W.09]
MREYLFKEKQTSRKELLHLFHRSWFIHCLFFMTKMFVRAISSKMA